MATTINESKTVKLLDGTEISLRPLKISLLRDFMKKFEAIQNVAEDNDKSISALLECVGIALKQFKPEIAEDLKALEDNIDLPTVYEIIEEASGYTLGGQVLGNRQ
jgi:inhibitor of KinA sporulation pathway (predicted exonuclease)